MNECTERKKGNQRNVREHQGVEVQKGGTQKSTEKRQIEGIWRKGKWQVKGISFAGERNWSNSNHRRQQYNTL